MRLDSEESLEKIDFAKGDGLVPVVAQHADTGEVLMLGYGDRAALEATLRTGLVHFHSRRRDALWRKGETSGNELRLVALHGDCDGDAVVALAIPAGPTCHTGARSCFAAPPLLGELAEVLDERAAQHPTSPGTTGAQSYTARLFADRNLRLKKLAEESAELAIACADGDRLAIAEEAGDLLYHSMVACRSAGVRLEDVLTVLRRRRESA